MAGGFSPSRSVVVACVRIWGVPRISGIDPPWPTRNHEGVSAKPAPPGISGFLPVVIVAMLAGLGLAAAESPPDQEVAITVVDAQGKPVGHAVVCLFPREGAPPDTEPKVVTIVQKDLAFTPLVSVARRGDELVLPNQDDVLHHVYSLSEAKTFDLPLYGKKEPGRVGLDKLGAVTLGCNIHDTMVAHVWVADTPWGAVTGEDGVVRFPGLPPGGYRAEVWHPRHAEGVVRAEVESGTAGGKPVAVTLPLPEEGRVRQPVRRRYRR